MDRPGHFLCPAGTPQEITRARQVIDKIPSPPQLPPIPDFDQTQLEKEQLRLSVAVTVLERLQMFITLTEDLMHNKRHSVAQAKELHRYFSQFDIPVIRKECEKFQIGFRCCQTWGREALSRGEINETEAVALELIPQLKVALIEQYQTAFPPGSKVSSLENLPLRFSWFEGEPRGEISLEIFVEQTKKDLQLLLPEAEPKLIFKALLRSLAFDRQHSVHRHVSVSF